MCYDFLSAAICALFQSSKLRRLESPEEGPGADTDGWGQHAPSCSVSASGPQTWGPCPGILQTLSPAEAPAGPQGGTEVYTRGPPFDSLTFGSVGVCGGGGLISGAG